MDNETNKSVSNKEILSELENIHRELYLNSYNHKFNDNEVVGELRKINNNITSIGNTVFVGFIVIALAIIFS